MRARSCPSRTRLFFAARQDLDRFEGVVAGKHHGAADVARGLPIEVFTGPQNFLFHGPIPHQTVDMGLVEESHLDVGVALDMAPGGPEFAGKGFEKRGLALAVAADDGDAVMMVDRKSESLKERLTLIVTEGQVVDGHQVPAFEGGFAETEFEVPEGVQFFLFLHLVQRFDPGLDQVGQDAPWPGSGK